MSIPAFEGQPVDSTKVKVSGAIPADSIDDDVVLRVDDIMQVATQFRCVAVHHKVDEKTGNLTRIQVIRPIEMVLVPFDPTDPDDIGILRSPRPNQIVSGTVVAGGGE